jgi:hypothetical protein
MDYSNANHRWHSHAVHIPQRSETPRRCKLSVKFSAQACFIVLLARKPRRRTDFHIYITGLFLSDSGQAVVLLSLLMHTNVKNTDIAVDGKPMKNKFQDATYS